MIRTRVARTIRQAQFSRTPSVGATEQGPPDTALVVTPVPQSSVVPRYPNQPLLYIALALLRNRGRGGDLVTVRCTGIHV